MNQMTKHIQTTIRKIITIMITSIVSFSLLPTNIILAENSKTSASLNDYSELLVDVMQDSEIVYSGKLGGFANGAYANVNFEKLDLLCVYQLSEDKTFTIIPRKNQANTNNTNNTSIITNDNNIVSVCFRNNNRYAENNLTQGLIYEVTFQNKLSSAKKFMPFFVVYSKDGTLKKIYKGEETTALGKRSATAQVGIDVKNISATDTVKAMVWNPDTMESYIQSQIICHEESDFYGNTQETATLIPDISKDITGSVTKDIDEDWIKFNAEFREYYTFCFVNAQVTLHENGRSYSLTSGERRMVSKGEHYLQIRSESGKKDYVLWEMTDDVIDSTFDVYEHDLNVDPYKKKIETYCDSCYDTDAEQAAEVYTKYQQIIDEDSKLHQLPSCMERAIANIKNYDKILNLYYTRSTAQFENIQNRYKELAAQCRLNDTFSLNSIDDAEKQDVLIPLPGSIECSLVANPPSSEVTENEDVEETVNLASNSEPSLQIISKTTTSVTVDVQFPISEAKGNCLRIYDFNTETGNTSFDYAVTFQGHGVEKLRNGHQTINRLRPGGIYVLAMMWSTDGGETCGAKNTIFQRVQLDYDSEEEKSEFVSPKGHVTAVMENDDIPDESNLNTWLKRMDTVYEDLREFTGNEPYDNQSIFIESDRNDFNTYQPNGQDYWRLIMGLSGNPVRISQPFFRSHMNRITHMNDWGDTPIHELSHDFDKPQWEFDAETLAFLKLDYVLENHTDARVYRIDTMTTYAGLGNTLNQDSYYKFLKKDWFEGYDQTFGKGTYSPAGLAVILLNIKDKIGWEPFSQAFQYIGNIPFQNAPSDELGKLNLFLRKLGDFSGKGERIFNYITEEEKTIIENEFGKGLKWLDDLSDPSLTRTVSGRTADIHVRKGDHKQYQFVPQTSGNYAIYTGQYGETGAPNNTYLEVKTTNSETETPMAENDNYGEGVYSRVDVHLEAGQPYFITVHNANPNNSILHARLYVVKTNEQDVLTTDATKNVNVGSSELHIMRFTPNSNGVYSFSVIPRDGSKAYLKLFDRTDLTNRIAQSDSRVIEYLEAGKTYYLQFCGYLMRAANGSVTAKPGHTLEFTKDSDRNFIYVNNPEYIANEDIVDDTESRQDKLFEQKNITGKNTYYQTHLAWYNSARDMESYPAQDSFYLGVDFYNPNDYAVTVDVSNLVAAENKTYLSHYVNKTGENPETITIQPYKHAQLFDYTVNKFECHRVGDLPSLFLMFDFEVKKSTGGNIPDGQGITLSSLAAYDYENMRLKEGNENDLVCNDVSLKHGNVLYGYESRPTEHDLNIKYKGIARNQSNQIDANIELAIDNNTNGEIPIQLKDNGDLINGCYPAKQTDWNVQINPIHDTYEALVHTTVGNLHKFTYHFDDTKQWFFDYKHHNTNYLTSNDNSAESINQPVPEDVLTRARSEIMSGHKSTNGSLDDAALEMGSWGVVYHYTITVNNTGTKTRKLKYRVRATAHYTLIGMREDSNDKYTFKDTGDDSKRQIPFEVEIPPGQKTFEVVTLCGGGNGGLENTMIIE